MGGTSSNDWDKIQKAESLQELIAKVEKICVRFKEHKQEMFNLVQPLKTLFPEVGTGKKIPPGRVFGNDTVWAVRFGYCRDRYIFLY